MLWKLLISQIRNRTLNLILVIIISNLIWFGLYKSKEVKCIKQSNTIQSLQSQVNELHNINNQCKQDVAKLQEFYNNKLSYISNSYDLKLKQCLETKQKVKEVIKYKTKTIVKKVPVYKVKVLEKCNITILDYYQGVYKDEIIEILNNIGK